MSRSNRAAILGAVCVLVACAATVHADPQNLINISGATLFNNFFKSQAATNDFIDADNDGYYGFHFSPPYVEQLAGDWVAPLASWNPYWAVQYRGVGSGNGLKEMVDFYNRVPGSVTGAPFVVPSDTCTLNRTVWCTTAGVTSPGNPANPGSDPVPPARIDIGVMDVPTKWFIVQGSSAQTTWNRKPLTNGYGQNPAKSNTGQGNTLKNITASDSAYTLNTNTASPDGQTIFDTPIAWVPSAFIANRGTGLQNVDVSDLQYMYVTGRAKDGQNIVVATRDSGSGTRNGVMNSIGLDPSWGMGDNTGSKSSDGTIAQIGTGHRDCNLDGTGIMSNEVYYHRLSIGYVGLDTAIPAVNAGKYEIVNVRKDIAGGTSYVRPSVSNVLHNSNVNTGWQIGGAETMATVGDPEAPTSGNPAMANPAAAAYVRNITHSIAAFSGSPSSNLNYNMPGEYMASQYFLQAALDAVPQSSPTTDPIVFVANPAFNLMLQSWIYNNTSIPSLGDFGTVNAAGLVPTRAAGTYVVGYGPNRTSGGTGNDYRDSKGNTLVVGTTLAACNALTGDFNVDHKRDWNDIDPMVSAVLNPAAFNSADANHGGNPGAQAGDYLVINVTGDFNGDGNFDQEDVRYFADGLAINPTTGLLDRKQGFTKVDLASAAHGGSANFFGTTLVTGKPYIAGASRGDVTGPSLVNQPGARPTADGTIDQYDLRYVKAQIAKAAANLAAYNTAHSTSLALPVWGTATAGEATPLAFSLSVYAGVDLSADINGDMRVDFNDLQDLQENCMGSHIGDIDLDGKVILADLKLLVAAWNTTSTSPNWNPEADVDGDGAVILADLKLLVANWNKS